MDIWSLTKRTRREWLGWHFANGPRLAHPQGFYNQNLDDSVPDGPPIVEGKMYEVNENNIHLLYASGQAIDALGYGTHVSRVRLSGKIKEVYNMASAHQRTVLKHADATAILHEFALWCAERPLRLMEDKGFKVDPRAWAAIEAKRQWLGGKISLEALKQSRAAAASWAGETAATPALDTAKPSARTEAEAAAVRWAAQTVCFVAAPDSPDQAADRACSGAATAACWVAVAEIARWTEQSVAAVRWPAAAAGWVATEWIWFRRTGDGGRKALNEKLEQMLNQLLGL